MLPIGLLLSLTKMKSFIFKHWKIFLGIAIVVAAYFMIQDMKSDAFDAGTLAEKDRMTQVVADLNKKNREYERKLTEKLLEFNTMVTTMNNDRITKESTHTETIREQIKDNPIYVQCEAETSVVDEINKIRDLGPK